MLPWVRVAARPSWPLYLQGVPQPLPLCCTAEMELLRHPAKLLQREVLQEVPCCLELDLLQERSP